MLPLALIVFVVLSSFVGKCGHPDTLFSDEARKFYLAGKDVLRSTIQRMLLGQTVHEIANTIRVQSEETCPAFIAEHTSNFREPPGTLGTTSSATMNQIYGTVGRPLESPLVISVTSPPCQCHPSAMTLYQSKFLQYLPMLLVALLLLPCVAEIYRLLRSFLKPSPSARPSKEDVETLVNTRDGRPAIVSLQVFDISTASMNSRAFQLAFPESINSPDRAVSLGPAIVAPPGVSIPAAPIPAIVVTDAVPTTSSSSSVSTGSTNEAPNEPGPSSSTRSGVVRRHVEAYQALASSSSSSNSNSSSRTMTREFGQRRASAGTTTTTTDDSFSSSSRSPGVPVYITPHRRRFGEPALWRRSSAPDLCVHATATPGPVVDEEVDTVARAPVAPASESPPFDESGLLGAEDEAPVFGVFGDRTNVPGPSGLVAESEFESGAC